MQRVEPLPSIIIEQKLREALLEDLGRAGDITTNATIPASTQAHAHLVAREPGYLAGVDIAAATFRMLDPSIRFTTRLYDSSPLKKGEAIAAIEGPARAILTGERVALNFLGRLSGVATATANLASLIAHTKARVTCTRKTTPGLRAFEKYAVRCGGGINHRFGLDDAVLIKDNHIIAAGGLTQAVSAARTHIGHMVKLEVEVDTLKQLEEALGCKVDTILLDNMTPATLKEAVQLTQGRARLEASGNITAATIKDVAETGVDFISSGAITHSAKCLDVALDFK